MKLVGSIFLFCFNFIFVSSQIEIPIVQFNSIDSGKEKITYLKCEDTSNYLPFKLCEFTFENDTLISLNHSVNNDNIISYLFYRNGVIRMLMYYDSLSKKRNGPFLEFYETGKIKTVGQHGLEGLSEGLWQFYDEEGRLEKEGTFIVKEYKVTEENLEIVFQSQRNKTHISLKHGLWKEFDKAKGDFVNIFYEFGRVVNH